MNYRLYNRPGERHLSGAHSAMILLAHLCDAVMQLVTIATNKKSELKHDEQNNCELSVFKHDDHEYSR